MDEVVFVVVGREMPRPPLRSGGVGVGVMGVAAPFVRRLGREGRVPDVVFVVLLALFLLLFMAEVAGWFVSGSRSKDG